MLARDGLTDARSAYWDHRLENWALWRMGAEATGTGSATDGKWGGEFTRPPPPLVGEALDTEGLVLRLEFRLHEALIAWYVWTGTQEDRALRLHVHANTLRNRVREGKEELDAMYWSSVAARPSRTDR